MKKSQLKSIVAAFLTGSCLTAPASTVITFFDFETEVPSWFSFAQNGAAVATVQVIPGVGGTDGLSTRVISDPGTFAGGGVGGAAGPIDLVGGGVTAGGFTLAQFDNIRIQFDVNIPVGQAISVRVEAGNGGFGERVDLVGSIAGTGAFQTISVDATTGSAAQKTTMVNFMNTGSATGIKFVYGIANQSAVPAGTDFVFDNFRVTYVPEPSSVMALTLVGALGLVRRRRQG